MSSPKFDNTALARASGPGHCQRLSREPFQRHGRLEMELPGLGRELEGPGAIPGLQRPGR